MGTAPPAVLLTGGKRNGVTKTSAPARRNPTGSGPGRPSSPLVDALFAHRDYDHDFYRSQVHDQGVVPAIALRGTRHGTGLGRYRRVVDRTFA